MCCCVLGLVEAVECAITTSDFAMSDDVGSRRLTNGKSGRV